MNDLQNKSQLRREQNAVLDEVKQCLTNKTSCGSRAIGYLIFEHLKSDPTWAYPERWLDGTTDLITTVKNSDMIQTIGYLCWIDDRFETQGDDLFDATFQLVQTPEGEALDYTIRFCAEGIVRRITPASFDWALVDDPDAFLPDLDQLFAFLVKTPEEDEPSQDQSQRSRSLEWKQELRIRAAELLGKAGERGRQKLLTALELPDSVTRSLVLYALEELIKEADFILFSLEPLFTDENRVIRVLSVAVYFHFHQCLPPDLKPFEFVADLLKVFTTGDDPISTNKSLGKTLPDLFPDLINLDRRVIDTFIHGLEMEGDTKWISIRGLRTVQAFTQEQYAGLLRIASDGSDHIQKAVRELLWKRGHPQIHQQYWEVLLNKQSPFYQEAQHLILYQEYDWREAPELIAGYWKLVEPHDKLRLIHKLARRRNRLRSVRAHFREITPQLMEWLHHPDFSIQSEAAEALAAIGENAELVVPALLEKLRPFADNPEDFSAEFEDRPSFLRNMIESLGRFGPAARQAIPMMYRIGASLESKRYLLTRIMKSLPEFGPEGVRTLFSLVRSREDDYVRDWRVRRILVPYGATFVPQLIEAMNIPELQPMVVQTLSAIGPEAKAAIPILLHAFHHQNTCGRTALADCFGCIGEGDPAVIAALSSVTRDADLELRLMAIDALRRVGKPATEVLRDLIECPPTEAPDLTLCWALNALSECGDESHETRVLCQNRLSHPSAGVRFFARCVLGKMSCPDPAGNVSVR